MCVYARVFLFNAIGTTKVAEIECIQIFRLYFIVVVVDRKFMDLDNTQITLTGHMWYFSHIFLFHLIDNYD